MFAIPDSIPPSPALSAVVYLSGPITDNPDFKRHFASAKKLMHRYYKPKLILTPAIFPPGWDYDHYMEHCLIMVRRSTAIVMLPGWRLSRGACTERAYAESLRLHVHHLSFA
jgi:hypothetical protein